MALKPDPVIGTAKAVSSSALVGLLTVSVAVKGHGQCGGGIPPDAVDGNHGQLSCGENEIVIEQLCCGASVNVAPGELAQVSCSVKFGTPSKSLGPNRLVVPACGLNDSNKPVSGVPERAVLVRVMVCAVAADPTCCGGKVSEAGTNVIGCVQPSYCPKPGRRFRCLRQGFLPDNFSK